MTMQTMVLISLVLAMIPCGLFILNLLFYRRLQGVSDAARAGEAGFDSRMSVLVPARNEEKNIRPMLESVLANRGVDFELVVLDDHSTDGTAKIVRELAARDARVRLEDAPELPPGWCGKQHACHVLAERSRNPMLVFMDADVRLAPDALRRMTDFMQTRGIALASGVPRQELGTFSERLLIPLIHFVLLGYLPMFMMRWTTRAAFSAGCGQLFIVRRDAYRHTGGHSMIRATLHDGVKLPRLFRRTGFKTDLFDATDVATCRMYQTNSETWRGLGKNATEGLAAPGTIVPMTLLLFFGQVLPFALLGFGAAMDSSMFVLAALAVAFALLPRIIAARRFCQPLSSALLHPLGISALLAIQWLAFARKLLGQPMEWKGRAYSPASLPSKSVMVAARVLILVGLFLCGFQRSIAGESTNLVCSSFQLSDQFGTQHNISFPRTNVVVLTIADKKGNDEVDGWVVAVKERFGGRVDILGIADVDGVPGPLREFVRKKFQKARSHPVMMDWDGNVIRPFKPQKDHANVYVIGRQGCVMLHLAGVSKSESLKELFATLDHAAPDPAVKIEQTR